MAKMGSTGLALLGTLPCSAPWGGHACAWEHRLLLPDAPDGHLLATWTEPRALLSQGAPWF